MQETHCDPSSRKASRTWLRCSGKFRTRGEFQRSMVSRVSGFDIECCRAFAFMYDAHTRCREPSFLRVCVDMGSCCERSLAL
jgi:hypothetical protein